MPGLAENQHLCEVVDDVVRALAAEHPDTQATLVDVVVRQAAGELLGRQRVADDFARLLRLRSDARLLAMAGVLTPIRGRSYSG
ncbi:MAG: hypothetical protein M3443_16660 [Actinomycetota bacterium]|nr:hypothetical protein [Actinomycetota bacterium]